MPLPLVREMVLQHAGHQTRVLEMPPLEAQGVVVFSKTLAWVIESGVQRHRPRRLKTAQ